MADTNLNNTSDSTSEIETEGMNWENTFGSINLSVSEKTATEQVIALFEEIADNDKNKIKELLKLTDKHQNTFLLKVVRARMVGLAQMLIEMGADIDAKNDSGYAALYQAVSNEDEKMTQMLLDKNAAVDIQNNDMWTSLYQAVFNKNIRIGRMLLNKGANVNIQNNKGWAPLHLAALNEDMDFIKELLEKNADINLEDNEGKTPFSIATLNRASRIIREFGEKVKRVDLRHAVEHVAEDLDAQGFLKRTLGNKYEEPRKQDQSEQTESNKITEEETVKKNDSQIIKQSQSEPVAEVVKPAAEKTITERKIKKETEQPKVKSEEKKPKEGLFGKLKRKFMKYWLFSWQKIDWDLPDEVIAKKVQKLIDAGADVNARDGDDDTVLILASAHGKLQTVKTLLANNADVNLKGDEDCVALYWAACNGYADIIQELAKKGARPNEVNVYGETPLIEAVKEGQIQAVENLLKMKGINLNLKDSNGDFALIIAVENNSSDIFEKLVNSKDINLNLQNADKQTSLMAAAKNGNTDMMRGLILNHADENILDGNRKSVSDQLREANQKVLRIVLKKAIFDRDEFDRFIKENQDAEQLANVEEIISSEKREEVLANLNDNNYRGKLRDIIDGAQKALRKGTPERKEKAKKLKETRKYYGSEEARRIAARMKKEETYKA